MLLEPEKVLVFSSVSDDSIGLQVYRFLYEDACHDLIFLDDEYQRTDEMKNFVLPSDSGETFVDAEELLAFLHDLENIEVIEYENIGIFSALDLGFNFTDVMISDIIEYLDTDTTELERQLSPMSYIDRDWFLIDWDSSKELLVENLSFILNKDPTPEKIKATIQESVKVKKMFYPEVFEVLLYVAELYDAPHIFLRTTEKVFCVKTTLHGPFPHFIYNRKEVNEQLEGLDKDTTLIIDLNAILLNQWRDSFNDPLSNTIEEV